MTPETKRAFEEHRENRASELTEIAEVLVRAQLLQDPSRIQIAAGQCRGPIRRVGAGFPDSGRQYWGYQIDELQLNLEEQQHILPRNVVFERPIGVLSVMVQEYVPESIEEIENGFALLRQAAVQFHIDAFQPVDNDLHRVRAAWHMDTHLYETTPGQAAHPRFHFQVGGFKLDEFEPSIRGVLLPEAPRVPCAPLDGILAVDFILSHYCGAGWQNLRLGEPRYGRVRKSPIQRYWSPYYRTLADGIEGLDNTPSGGDAASLIPSICM